jgi:polar amino acid transport system substrate-binding protein
MPRRTLILGLLLLIAILAVPVTATANNALDSIIKAKSVRIAVPDNFPPFGDLGPDAKLVGYDIDVAALIASALGVKLELVPVSSTDRIAYLTAGKVDLVISSLGKDGEREKAIDFSIAYAPFYSAVFGPERIQVVKPGDLAGKTVAVTRNTIEDMALTGLAPATATIKRYEDNAGTEVAYLSSRAKLIATGNVVAAEVLGKSPMKKTAIKFLLANSPCYVGVKKNEPDLLAAVNATIGAALKDGSLNRISEHWLKAPLGDPEHPSLIGIK